jgi:hypothetical protein
MKYQLHTQINEVGNDGVPADRGIEQIEELLVDEGGDCGADSAGASALIEDDAPATSSSSGTRSLCVCRISWPCQDENMQ